MENFVYKLSLNNLRTRLFTSARKAALFMINHADIHRLKLQRKHRMPSNVATELRREGHIEVAALESNWRMSHPTDGRPSDNNFWYKIIKEEVF